jgi:prevent-host-death family protein
MSKRISATDAKNNFGGLLEDVASLGRVDIIKHGRLVAVVLAPRALEAELRVNSVNEPRAVWGANHMISPEQARGARLLTIPSNFDEDPT